MMEKYYSIMNIRVEYWITDKIIERKKDNFTMRFCFTNDYYDYIKKTCIKFYPKNEILFIGYFKKIYNFIKLKEEIYATEAWNRGIK